MMKFLLIALIVLLTGCTSLYNKNHQTFIVSCSGFKNWDACYSEAKLVCSNQFNIINKFEDLVTQSRKLSYQCN